MVSLGATREDGHDHEGAGGQSTPKERTAALERPRDACGHAEGGRASTGPRSSGSEFDG